MGLLGSDLKKFWRKSKEILMKFGKLGISTKFIEKQCKFFVQLVDQDNFEEFYKKFEENFRGNFGKIFN